VERSKRKQQIATYYILNIFKMKIPKKSYINQNQNQKKKNILIYIEAIETSKSPGCLSKRIKISS